MAQFTGGFHRQEKGYGRAARVTLELDPSTQGFSVELCCTGKGWVGQGHLEEVSEIGYESWKEAAVVGVRWAFSRCGYPPCRVIVTSIVGMVTDTNPAAVAAAVALAVWKAVGYKASSELLDQLTEVVFTSSGYVPVLENILPASQDPPAGTG